MPILRLTKEALESGLFDPFGQGKAFREPIFYSGEAAYEFQYLDLALRKYAADAQWLEANRGFMMDQACRVAKAIKEVHTDHFDATREQMRKLPPDQWTMIPLFTFTGAEVAAKANLEPEVVDCVLDAFALPPAERNADFAALHDFNAITATPLLRMPSGEFLSLQFYSLAEALYDAPFYWMMQDKSYRPTLTKNRGDFTEGFIAERLGLVFGAGHV